MAWFSGSIAHTDVSQFIKMFTRDGSVCDVSYGVVMDMDTRAPTVQPAQLAEMDVDGVRWFTGYVVSVTAQRSAGTWVNRVVCDHYSLKRLRDYYWAEGNFAISNNTVNRVLDLAMDRAGAVYAIDPALQPAFSEIEIPPYEWSMGMNAYDIVLDMLLFGMVQANPLPDGSIYIQKMSPSRSPIDVTNRTTYHERRVDDAYFRTAALVLGWATEAAFVSGSSPYGYPRTMVVANPHVISGGPTLRMAEQLLSEYNKLTKIEKNTVPTRERINLGDSLLYQSDRYTETGIVMRNSANLSVSDSGFLQTITTGEKCPKIFGFEPMQPPPIVKKDVVVVMTHNQLARSLNFFTATSGSLVEWEDIGADISPEFANFVMADSGDAYLLNWDGNTGTSGLWHCGDISGESVGFSFVMSLYDIRNQPTIVDGGTAMAVTSDGTVYLPVTTAYPFSGPQYFWSGIGSLSYNSVAVLVAGATVQRQFATTCDNGTDVICGREHPYVGVGGYVNLATGENRDAYGIYVISSTTTDYAAGTYGASDTIFALWDGSAFQTDHHAGSQILQEKDSNHVFWLRYADGYLMQDGIIQAIPNDVGVDSGVFSGSLGGAGGAGVATVYGYGQIIWVAGTGKGYNSKGSICYTENGGVIWTPKDGNFDDIFPAGWSGNTSNVWNIVRFVAV